MRSFASLLTAAGLFIMLAVLFACTYVGRDDALSQRFTWFSYVNGDDIRAQCAPGALDRYRFVYNGVYVKQARTYDIVPDAASGLVLKARVLGPSDLSNVSIADPITTLFQDPLDILAPFAGTKGSIGLGGRDIDALDSALVQSGFPTGAGRALPAFGGLFLSRGGLRRQSADFQCVPLSFRPVRQPDLPATAVRLGSDRHPGKSSPRTDAVRHLRSGKYGRQVPPLHAYRRHRWPRRHGHAVLESRTWVRNRQVHRALSPALARPHPRALG